MLPAPTCAASRALVAEIDDALLPATGLAALLDAAHRVRRRPDLVRSRLAFLLSHPERLAEVAGRAYWHSNGFAKIKLLHGRGFTVRLHIWPASTGRGEVNPHGHRWEFASWILTGAGMSEAYYESVESSHTDATPYTRCDYGPGQLRPVGDASLRVQQVVRRPAGTVYTCTLDALHTVAPIGDGLVATVVLQGPALIHSARVFVRTDPGPEPAPRPIPQDELCELLHLVDAAFIEEQDATRLDATVGPPRETPAVSASQSRDQLGAVAEPTR
ncbi:hypothetical protein [Pseudonocardia humida]|uniref:Cysteine dioxygenase type I n=1 Tax=Pseudonocardia humida TaxID=2800819 RepID=A0ABT0ZWU8_9PSEU|nr:hypothetical protein [Pseudonocardia humida]MCO1655143.1 hypothetical protein [Pseudonocardia humida]